MAAAVRRLGALPATAAARAWRRCARTTVVIGLACAVGTWGAVWALSVALAAVMVVGVAAVLADADDVRRSLRRALDATLALLGTAGMVTALGWSGAGLLGLLVATRLFLHLSADDPASRDEAQVWTVSAIDPVTPQVDAVSLRQLDDHDLCQAWRRSFRELETSSLARRCEVVGRRQLYLDELERRHPAALRRWLTSGGRAAGNPLRYLARSSLTPEDDRGETPPPAADGPGQ